MAVHNSFIKQQAGSHHHNASSATTADIFSHNPTVTGSSSSQAQTPGTAQQDLSSPPQAFSFHMAEKMALGPQIVGLPSPLLLGSSQKKETLKGNGPETETPACSNES